MEKNLEYHINLLKNEGENSFYYRSYASFLCLDQIDEMTLSYRNRQKKEHLKGEILLDVFGLLQGLFVGIDALYDLSIGLTKYKYHVNINQNPVLHQLKYIRNDVVGHPTNRTYQKGQIGYSILNTEALNYDCIEYVTYVYEKERMMSQKHEVHFIDLIDQYHKEKQDILIHLVNYLNTEKQDFGLVGKILSLYEDLNSETLEQIIHIYKEAYQIKEASNQRFLWRTSLIKDALVWHENDADLDALVFYIAKYQVLKVLQIALDLENSKQDIPYLKLPSLLVTFFKYLNKNPELVDYLQYLHDYHHPLFQSDLSFLIDTCKNDKVKKLLIWFKDLKDERKTFLVGSIFKTYRKIK